RGVLPHSVAEHRQILKAIAAGDAEAAGRAMYEHVIESKERMLKGATTGSAPVRARATRKG
ncbi:MAG: FCD domain-containing protein, partial [Burkholderiaceae bacterium]